MAERNEGKAAVKIYFAGRTVVKDYHAIESVETRKLF